MTDAHAFAFGLAGPIVPTDLPHALSGLVPAVFLGVAWMVRRPFKGIIRGSGTRTP